MANGSVRIDGLRELDSALAQLPKATGRAVLRNVLKDAGEPIARTARAKAPVLTGNLRESVEVSQRLSRSQKTGGAKMTANGFRSESKNYVEMFVGPGTNPQAITQEFGTYKEPAQPYMRPAWDSQRQTALNLIINTLGPMIERAAARLSRKGG